MNDPGVVPAVLAAVGVTRFVVDDWGGAPIPVWLLRPASAKADDALTLGREVGQRIQQMAGSDYQVVKMAVMGEVTAKIAELDDCTNTSWLASTPRAAAVTISVPAVEGAVNE